MLLAVAGLWANHLIEKGWLRSERLLGLPHKASRTAPSISAPAKLNDVVSLPTRVVFWLDGLARRMLFKYFLSARSVVHNRDHHFQRLLAPSRWVRLIHRDAQCFHRCLQDFWQLPLMPSRLALTSVSVLPIESGVSKYFPTQVTCTYVSSFHISRSLIANREESKRAEFWGGFQLARLRSRSAPQCLDDIISRSGEALTTKKRRTCRDDFCQKWCQSTASGARALNCSCDQAAVGCWVIITTNSTTKIMRVKEQDSPSTLLWHQYW